MSQFVKHTSGPIDTSNPWSDDVLKRHELAQQLTAALSTVTQPFVLGLHGEFGNGKTFFLKRWQQELKNAGDVAVYFNVWETDYAADPLIAFTAAIKTQLEANDLIGGKEAAKALATSVGRIILKTVLPRAISLATGGLVQASDVSTLTAMGDEIVGAASGITEHAIEEVVKHHEEARDEVEHFRSILTNCAEAIAKRERGLIRRLIVFVDELDRCRPDYAVHVLECIMHFFAVDNIIFIVAIDRDALSQSIRAVYGDGIDVDGYLRKFFDYHVELGPPNHEAFALLLGQSLRLDEVMPSRLADWVAILSGWSKALNLSLRMQEQILAQANFIVRSYNTSNWFVHDLILISLCIQAKSHDLLDRMLGELGPELLQSEVDRLIDPSEKDDDLDRILRHGVMILLAGFVSPEAMRAEQAALESQLKAQRSDELPAGERRNIERGMSTLEQAFQIVERHAHRRSLGRSVVRRIRFLTE